MKDKKTNPNGRPTSLRRRPPRGFRIASFIVITPGLPDLRLKGLIREVRRIFFFGSVRATPDDKSHLLIALRRGFRTLDYLLFQDITLNLLPLAFETSIIPPLLLRTRLEVCLNWQFFWHG